MAQSRVVITGSNGLFGRGLQQVFASDHTVLPLPRQRADITDRPQVAAALREMAPDVVIHSAAIPDIDYCESHPEEARATNVEATRHLAELAKELGFSLALVSSDAVFDGKAAVPYTETSPTNPPTVYGSGKVEAEQIVSRLEKHWIFRVAVLFGPGKVNFVDRALAAIRKGDAFDAPRDQVAGATYTIDAAHAIARLVGSHRFGLFHVVNDGVCSRYDLVRRAAELAGEDATLIRPLMLDDMKRAAPRLKYSVMATGALRDAGIGPLPSWEDALKRYIARSKIP